MSESVTNVDLNFSNGGGGHTATVTSIVGAVSAETYKESLGEIAGNAGEKSLFSDSRIDSLMSRFVETEMTTTADPTKKTIVRKYVDSTSVKLNSYIVLVRGINAPPQGGSSFEGRVPYFSEVKGTSVPSFGALGATMGDKKTPVITLGSIYNIQSSTLADGEATSVNLIYQGKHLKSNLSLNEKAIPESYRNAPDPSKYSLKFGYTLNEFKEALDMAGIEHEGLDPDNGDDVLFEASGPLMGVVGSVAAHFGFYYYIDPRNGKLKFINSAIAATLTVADPTKTTDESVIAASFTKSAVTESIVNSYAGTAEKMDKSGMGGDGDDDGEELYSTFMSKVEIDKFQAFIDMKMGLPELGAYFQIFNQDQPTEMFDKYTYALLWLSQRNVKQNGVLPDANRNDAQFLKVNGKRYVMTLHGNVEYVGQKGGKVKKGTIIQPLYLPRPLNLELWSWGPNIDPPATQEIWAGRDARIKSNEKDLAQRANKGHQFQRYSKKTGKSLATYLGLAYVKSEAQLDWEDVDEEAKVEPMPKPSQSPLYEFLKNYFEIAGGVYVSHGYGKNRALRMGFENSNQITVSGPFHKNQKIRDFKELNALTSFFKILGIKREVTVGDLADLTNGEAKAVNPYHFIAIRNIPKLSLRAQMVKNGNKPAFDASMPANFGPLGTHCEIYDKPNQLNGQTRYLGGPLIQIKYQEDLVGKRPLFAKYINDLVNKSIKAYRATGLEMGIRKTMAMKYTLHDEEVHSLGDDGDVGDELIADNDVEVDPQRGERIDYHNKFDNRFYEVVAAPADGLTKPTLSAASGNTKEMKTLRAMRGDSQTSSGPNLTSSSKTIYGLHIPDFTPTINSLSISVGDGGIQTTIGESTVKIIPPDQQFLIGQGVEAAHGQKTDSRFGAHQRNHFGL